VSANYLWTIVLFAIVMAAAYRMVGRQVSRRDGAALVIGFLAAWPLLDGGFALEREIGRRYRGFRPSPFVNTADGFRLYDVLTRMLLTGSRHAWVVDFRYACGSSGGCVGRDFVPRELWTRLQPGQAVNIRSVEGRRGSGRLSENNDLLVPAVKFAMGGVLALIAVLVSRGVRPREKYVTVPAVVISVTSVPSGDTLHWKVRFAYFDENGVARESADEVFRGGLKAGDDCVARYPKGKPDLGTLDASHAAAA
jgi:hypothetical protein